MSLAHLWGTLANNRRTRRARRDAHHDRRRAAFRWHRLPLRMEPLEERIAPDATPLEVALATHNATAATLRLNGDELQVVRTDAPDDVLASRALVDVSAVNIVGDPTQPEALTIDYDLGGFFWVAGGVTFDGGAGPGDQLLVQGGGNRTWTVTGADAGTIDGGVSFAGVENLVGGADNEDTFVIAPGGTLSGSLEGGASGFDSLVIQDGGYATVEATATGPDAGSVALDGRAVVYAGLEPVTLPAATNVVITLTGGDDVAELRHVSGDNFILESKNATFESQTFPVDGSTASVTINLGGGADTITLTDLAFANFNNKLTVAGEDGSDTYKLGANWGTGVTLVEAGGAAAGTADQLDFGSFAGGPVTITPGVSNLTVSAAGGNSLKVANSNLANFESLTGANVDLTGSLTSVRTELVDGLKKVVDFARDLAAAGNFLKDLPVIGKNADVTIGKALDFAEALDEIRFQVQHFLDGTLPTLTTQDLINFINDKFQTASAGYVGALSHLGAAIFANKPLADADILAADVYDFKLTVDGTVYHVKVDVDASVTPSYDAGTKTLTFGLPDHGGPVHYLVSDMQTAINAAVSQVGDLSGRVLAALRNGRLAFQAVGTQINELKLAAGSAASAAATKLGLSTTDFVLSNVQKVLQGLGDLNVSLASGVTLGVSFEGGRPNLRFDVNYHGSRASDFFYDLGSEAQSLGLAFDVQAKLHALAQLTADLKLGLGLTGATTTDFFLDVDALNAGVSLSAGAISNVGLNLGFLGLKANGSLGLEAGLSLTPAALTTLHNVTDPSTIDVNALGVNLTAGNGTGSASFNVDLTLSVAAGTQDLGFSASGTLKASGNPFDGSDIDLQTDANFNTNFPDFNNLNAAGVVSLLGQVRTWLDGVRDSNAVSSLHIPFVQGGLDKILQLGDVVGNALLFDKGPDTVQDGADKLATDLNTALTKAGLDRLVRFEGDGKKLKLVAVDPKVTSFTLASGPGDAGGFTQIGFAAGSSSGSVPTISGSDPTSPVGVLTGDAGFTVTVKHEDSANVSGATESGTTATVTTSTSHGFSVGQQVVVSGVSVGGYNGTFTITAVPTPTTFQYTAASGLADGSGGTAKVTTTLKSAGVKLAVADTTGNTGIGDDVPKLLDASNAPTFTNTQEFVDRLAQILNLTFLHYDVATQVLTLKINFDNRPLFGVELPTDFNLDLSPIGNVTSDTRLFIDAKGGINLTLGFDLSATPAGSSALGNGSTLADDGDKLTVPVKREEAVTAAADPRGIVGQLSGDATIGVSLSKQGTSNGGNSSATRLHDPSAQFITAGVKVGDFVRDTTEGKLVQVTNVVSQTELDTAGVTNWSGDQYQVLLNEGASTGGASSATRLSDPHATFLSDGVKVGDFIRNTTEDKIVQVTKVVSQTDLDTTAVAGWTGDHYLRLVTVRQFLGHPGGDVNVSKSTQDQTETTISVNPADPKNIIIGANDDNAADSGNTNNDVVWVTTDGGTKWDVHTIPRPAGAIQAHGDPSVVFSRDGKRAVFVHLVDKDAAGNSVPASAVSVDGGKNWLQANTGVIGALTADEDGDGHTDDADKPYIAVGPDVHDLSKDSYVVTWHRDNVIYASTSADGVIWTAPVRVGNETKVAADGTTPKGTSMDPMPSFGPNGEIYVFWEDFGTPTSPTSGESRIVFDKSLDGGKTWGGGQDTKIFFDTNVSALTKANKDALDAVAAVLTANPQLRVEVAGYTDRQGDAAPNLTLSQDRAQSAADYLITTKGIDASRVTQLAFGENRLAVQTADGVAEQQNRRVELTFDQVIYTGTLNMFRDPFNGGLGHDATAERPPNLGEYEVPAQPDRGILMDLSADVDRSTSAHRGRIYVAFTDQGDLDNDPDAANATDHDNTDIFVIASDDGGATWHAFDSSPNAITTPDGTGTIVRVNDDTGGKNSQFFSWLRVDQTTGNVAVSWYDARNDTVGSAIDSDGAANTDVQYFTALSRDSGDSWDKNAPVSDGASNVTSARAPATTTGNQYGDYSALAFVNGTVFTAWVDNSNSTGDNADFPVPPGTRTTEVYFDRIPLVNQTIDDLLFDINTAIAAIPQLNGKVQAQADGNLVGLAAISPSVNQFTVTTTKTDPAFRDLGFQETADSVTDGGPAVVKAAKPAPALVGQLSADAVFTVDLNDGNGPQTVTVLRDDTVSPLAPNHNVLDLVNDVQKAVNTALGQNKITVSSTNGRLVFTRAGTPVDGTGDQFVITPGANAAELGLTGAQTSDEADFVITTADGTTHRIALDAAPTIGDVISAIGTQTGGKVTASLTADDPESTPTPVNEANTGLTLVDSSVPLSAISITTVVSGVTTLTATGFDFTTLDAAAVAAGLVGVRIGSAGGFTAGSYKVTQVVNGTTVKVSGTPGTAGLSGGSGFLNRLFKVVPTNGSVAAVKLGLVSTDTNPNNANDVPDGKIVGAKIAGATLLDRFFITADDLHNVIHADLTVQAGIVVGGLSAVSSTVVTATGYKFKATDVNKQLRIKGINGFTATTVTINSVDTTTNQATLSGSVGSAGLVGGTAVLLAGVKAGAKFGDMVSINLDGTASLGAHLSLGFNTNSPALGDSKLTLQELVDNLSHILDLVAPPDITPVSPATNFGTVDLKVGMGVAGGDLSGLAGVLGVDPKVTINVVTLGDPFMDTRFRQANYTKLSDTQFRVDGNFTAKLPDNVILRFDDGGSTNDFKVTGTLFTAGSPGTTTVTVAPADGSAALPGSLGDPHNDSDVDVGVTLQPKVDIQTSGLGGLPDLGHLSFAQIIAALQALSGFLGQFEAFGFLNTDLPIVNKSVNDLLAFAGDFAKAIDQAQSNPAGTLQVLEDKLNQAYGIAPDRLNEIVRLAGKGGITGATNATPIVITTADPHGLHTGDRVTITGVEGNAAANGTFSVVRISDTQFSLKKIEDGSDVAGTGDYTQGGTWSPDDVFDLSFDPSTHVIKFDFTVGTSFSKGLDVAIPGLDFGGALASLGLGNLVDLSGSAGLKAEGGVLLRLTLGMDIEDEFNLSDIADHLLVFDTTGLDGKLTVGGQDIAFRLGVGPFALSVAGTPTQPAEIQIAGTAHAGLKPAVFTDHAASFSTVFGNLATSFDGSLTGTVSGALPVFFPTDSTKLGVIRIGGSDGTGAFTATGNLLNMSRFDVRTQNPDQGTANAVVVDASQVVQGISNFDFSKFNIFDNIFLAVDGLDSVLGFLQDAVGGQLGSLSIPLIGGGLSKAAGFIGDLREDFIAPLRHAIETAKNAAQDFADPDKNIISKLLFDLLGPTGLDLLKHGPAYNAADGLSPADFIGLDTNLDEYLAGTGNVQLKDIFIQWDMDLGDTLVNESADIGFDLGIPGLGLKTEGDINLTVDWLLHLGFGLNMQDGFYLVTDNPATPQPDPELAFDVSVSLPAAITGTLGFLGLRAQDKTIDGHNTELGATFVVDLFERNATNAADRAHLGFTEFGQIGVNPGIAANASASLGMQLGLSPELFGQLFGSGAANVISGFPKVVGDFVFLWEIGDRNHGATLQQTVANSQFVALIQEANAADQNAFLGNGIGNAIQDGLKKVAIQDIGLDLGSFLSEVLGPLVQEVSKFTKPIQPLIDFVTSPIPIIGQLGLNITWLDLAQALAGDKVNVGLIKSVAEIITLVNEIASISSAGDVVLPIGNITIFNDTGTGTAFKPALWDSSLNLGNTFNQIKQTGGLLNDAITAAGGADAALAALAGSLSGDPQKQKAVNTLKNAANGTSAGGFSFPFLKDPSQIFGLLMGKDATLVAYDLAPLDFGFDFHQFFSIFGPLGVSIGLLANLHIDTAFGYDTHGIREFVETGFRNPALLFNGFFISDSPKLDGVDDPELTLQAELQAAAELNLGIARAGVAAAFGFKILFDLFDPDHDGKVRIAELIGNITNQLKAPSDAEKLLAPLAIFDVSGEIYARLFAFLEIDFGFFSFEKEFPIFGPVTLLSFNVDFFRPPILATEQDNGDLIINTGKFAKQRLLGNATDVAENLVIKSVGTDGDFVKVQVKSADGAVGEDADVFQDYKVRKGHKIIIDGGQGDDRFDLTNFTESGVLFEVDLGEGNDQVVWPGSTAGGVAGQFSTFHGGRGDDRIDGTGGSDLIFGDEGNDAVNANAGDDLVFGDAGEVGTDTARGLSKPTDGGDKIDAGAGRDIVFGGGGKDDIQGGADADLLIGGGGLVTFTGPAAFKVFGSLAPLAAGGVTDVESALFDTKAGDKVAGGGGDDLIFGTAGPDDLSGDAGNDKIFGMAGFDKVDAGTGDDLVFGDRGQVTAAGPAPVDGGDADSIQAGSGNDVVYAGGGSDLVQGGDGDDSVYGGSGPDIIFGDNGGIDSITGLPTPAPGSDGDDIIFGEGEPDRIFGGGGLDRIDGGIGADDIHGGAGGDLIIANKGNDVLNGEEGGDSYLIDYQGGNAVSLMQVIDDGSTGTDIFVATGTVFDDKILLRANAAGTLAFVALINSRDRVERINYVGVERIIVNGSFGNDYIASDDTTGEVTVNGDFGDDTFQVGQMFKSQRGDKSDLNPVDFISDVTGISFDDAFADIETTRGFLSNGISAPMTINGGEGNDNFTVFHNKAVLQLNGEGGDDTFTIRAFALAGSQEPQRERTDISGGEGADLIQYVVNAPVNIDGGDGYDTVVIIGTEFGDDFVITDSGVFGAGLNVNFVNIESLRVDGAEGDDRFFVKSTSEKFTTELFGGLGSDTFNMSGDTPPIVSNDLLGHSGVVTHDVESLDDRFDGKKVFGVSANVADNDEPFAVIRQTQGSTIVTEGDATGDSYQVVLTRAPDPGMVVEITVLAPIPTPTDRERRSQRFRITSPTAVVDPANNQPSADGTALVLRFTDLNWSDPQTVNVFADGTTVNDTNTLFTRPELVGNPDAPPPPIPFTMDDTAEEGIHFGVINHLVNAHPTALPATVKGLLTGVDNGAPSVTIADPGGIPASAFVGRTLVISGGDGTGQIRTILAVNDTGPTLVLTLDRPFIGTVPTTSSTFLIQLDDAIVGKVSAFQEDAFVATDPKDHRSTFTDSSANFPTAGEGLIGSTLEIIGGPGAGQQRLILGHVSGSETTQLILNGGWGIDPVPGQSTYRIKRFAGLVLPSVTVQVNDNDLPGLIVDETQGLQDTDGTLTASDVVPDFDTVTSVTEGGDGDHLGERDVLRVRPTKDPGGTIQVKPVYDASQLVLTDLAGNVVNAANPLTFDSGDWSTFKVLVVRALADDVREGFHNSLVRFEIGNGSADTTGSQTDAFKAVPADRPVYYVGLEHTPTAGSVSVTLNGSAVAAAGFAVVGNKVVFLAGGTPTPVSGDISVSYQFTKPGFASAVTAPVVVRINDADAPTVVVRESGGSTDVVETASADPFWGDSYDLVLSGAPTAPVTVTVAPQVTKTTRTGGIRHDLKQVTVSSSDPRAVANADGTLTVTFTAADWDDPVTVGVRAIDDGVVDGSDTQVFAPGPNTVSGILGPVSVEGAGGRGTLAINAPLMLPGEKNVRKSDGVVVSFTANPVSTPGALEQMVVNTAELTAKLGDLGLATINGLVGLTIEMSKGNGVGVILDPTFPREEFDRFWLITGVADAGGGHTRLTLQNPSQLNVAALPPAGVPTAGSEYAITKLSANFFVDERTQVDYMFVHDEDSPADSQGYLTASRLWGLNMGPDLVIGGRSRPGGITYGDLEVMEVNLGSGNNDFQVLGTHTRPDGYQTWTFVNGGDDTPFHGKAGDTVTVKLNAADVVTATGSVAAAANPALANGFTVTATVPGTFADGSLAGQQIRITADGQTRTILGNVGNALTLDRPWETLPTGQAFQIVNPADGAFAVNTQGGNDTVDASASTLGVVMFGGDGSDSLTGGSGDDIVFGDRGRVDYFNEAGAIVTRLGDAPAPITGFVTTQVTQGTLTTLVDSGANFPLPDGLADGLGTDDRGLIGLYVDVNTGKGFLQTIKLITGNTDKTLTLAGGFDPSLDLPGPGPDPSQYRISTRPENQTDGVARDPGLLITVDNAVGGSDQIRSGAGNDKVFGGAAGDDILSGAGDDVVVGDAGRLDLTPDPATPPGPVVFPPGGGRTTAHTLADRLRTIDFATGGADTFGGGAGADLLMGGNAGDTVYGDDSTGSAGAADGRDVVIGDNGEIKFTNGVVNHIFTTDTAEATGGADNVHGNAADDMILGGVNNGAPDVLSGDAGNDMVLGDNGEFVYDAEAVDDLTTLDAVRTLDPSRGGADQIFGDADQDLILAGTGDDTGSGGAQDDIVFGDFAEVLLVNNELTTFRTTQPTLGGSDVLYGNGQNDVLIGGARGDAIDGGQDQDLIFGDAVEFHRRPGHVITNPRFQTLVGTQIYSTAATNAAGGDLVDGTARNYRDAAGNPVPTWAEFQIDDLRHTAALQAAPDNSFGDDYIAGGTGHDQIFAQLGDDTVQGDGSIDFASTGNYAAKGTRVGAARDGSNGLLLNPSFEDPADGDDYIEGNGGNDVVFGNLGQDDIIGGSSNLFTLDEYGERPDGSDLIFGGSGLHAGRYDSGDLASNQRHARDADSIVADNGDIFRLVGTSHTDGGGFLTFNYDQNSTSLPFEDRGALRIVPRANRLLDYTPGGPDFTPAVENAPADVAINPATGLRDIGAADEVHGEGGDDEMYGMVGRDVLFGDAQDDVMVGGYGADWMSGGTGEDGMLGDDGRLRVSRNSTSVGEPLYGVAAIPAAEANKVTQQNNGVLFGVVNVTPTAFQSGLKFTADLTPQNLQPGAPNPPNPLFRPLYANDVMFGGGGNDAMHGGAGDDAVSGAEALAGTTPATSGFTNNYDNAGARTASHLPSDFAHPLNPGNPLGYQTAGANATKFALFDANDPLRTLRLNAAGNLTKDGTGDQWFLNFDQTDGITDAYWVQGTAYAGKKSDGDDHMFGDLGNDWLVGGTGRDVMFTGWGDDLVNLDDDLTTPGTVKNGTFSPGTDTNPSYEDLAFGGAGRDVLLLNTNGDRAIDWNGEFNSYLTPWSQFGSDSVIRLLQPATPQFLYDLSKSAGADQTLAAQYGTAAARNGEPFGEIGLVTSQDAAWNDQKGGPRDPQPGNTGGAPVDLSNGNATAGTRPIYSTAVGGTRRADRPTLTDAQLAPVVAQAKAFWAAVLGPGRAAELERLQVVVGDLPDNRLGALVNGVVILDGTAAGRGWFVDPTPGENSEFAARAKRLLARPASPAFGRIDLLSVVLHEIGHALGLDHELGGVMNAMLRPGERTLPEPAPMPGVNVAKGGGFLSRVFRR